MKTGVFIFLVISLPLIVQSQKINQLLGRPTNNSITVSIMSDTQTNVFFEYGTEKGTYTFSSPVFTCTAGIPAETDITGLKAATRYFYRTRYKLPGSNTYNASSEYTFITQRAKGNTFRFTVEADPHPYDKKGCWELFDIALQNQLNDTADFMIDLGDTFGDDHNPTTITANDVAQLQLNCRNFFGKVSHSLPFYFCIGNHEGESGYYLLQTPPDNLAVYETLWRKTYFPNPYPNSFYSGCTNAENYGMGQTENYYAWEWGDALFVVLDMYRYADANEKPQKWDFTIGKEQYDWFKNTLENSHATFKFVFSHHILGQGRGGIELANSFEWGGYDAGIYKFDTYRPGWGLPLHQLMKQNKVDIFFQGHDHIFVRQELDSIVYQTVPMPSDSSYKIGITDNGDAFLSGVKLAGAGHLRVTVKADSLTVDFVNAVLPKHETAGNKNRQISFSYSIKKENTSSGSYNPPQSPSVFPNPANEFIYINLPEDYPEKSIVKIYNSTGCLMFSETIFNAPALTVNLANFNAGIYIINIENEKDRYVGKFIKLD